MQLSHSQITKAIYQAAEIEYDNKSRAYDRTIQATIIRAADPLTGEVRVKYQDTILSAYITDLQKANDYIKGKNVYISIPNNDMSQIKTVIGLVEGNNKISFVENEENYTLLSDKWFDDISKDNFDKEKLGELLIEKINLLLKPVNIVNPKPAVLLLKIEKMSANIKYDPLKNKNYGIKITLKVNKILKEIEGEWQETSPSEEDEKIDFIFDMDDITGYPLKYSEQNQFTLFTLVTNNGYPITEVSSLDSESSIELIEKDLNLDDSWNFEGLNFYSAKINEPLTNEGLVLGIQASRNFFSEGNETDIVLKPILKSAGITQDLSDENIAQCYWYRYDGSTFEKYSSGELLVQEVKEKGKTDEEGIIDETISDEDAIKNYKDKLQKQKYDYKAGFGWECLNDTYIRSEDNIYEDSDGNSYIYIEKGYYPYSTVDYRIKEKEFGEIPKRTYKLIVIFNNQIVSKEIDIYNKTCNYSVEVKISNKNEITSILKSNKKIDYISKIYLKTISGTRYFIGTTENDNPFNCTDTLKKYQGQFYIEVDCFIDNFFIITGKVDHLIRGAQTSDLLFIENGEQVFLYENKKYGEPNSPILSTAIYPSVVKQLKAKFVHLNGDGTSSGNSDNMSVIWFIPKDYNNVKTLIDVNVEGISFEEAFKKEIEKITIEGISFDKDQWILYKSPTLDFNIKSFYDENAPLGTYSHNDIYAYYTYSNNGETSQLLARTNFSFAIEGDPGTNGTGVYCRIVPNYEEGTFLPPYTMYTEKKSSTITNYSLNQKPENDLIGVPHFRVQLWKNNEKIFDDTAARERVSSISWSWLTDDYGKKALYEIMPETGVFYKKNLIKISDIEKLTQWIEVSLFYENIMYKSYYPIVYCQQEYNTTSEDDDTKYITLTYNSICPIFALNANDGGELPRNKELSYKILSSININNNKFILLDNLHRYFSFNVVSDEEISLNFYQLWLLNSYNDKVIYLYDGHHENDFGYFCYPIGLFKRSSSGDFIQGWTKPYLVDEKNGQVFAKAYIGGEKNNNKLTGIIAGAYQEQNGYAAYKDGNRIFMVDAEKSTMSIGESAAAQVMIASTNEGGIIKSPLFDSNIDEEGGLQGSGLKINLSKPSIEYKNKNVFSLNENGEGYLSNWIINNNYLATYDKNRPAQIAGYDSRSALMLGDSQVSENGYLYTPKLYPWSSSNIIDSSVSKVLATSNIIGKSSFLSSFLTSQGDFALKNLFIVPSNRNIDSNNIYQNYDAVAIGGLLKKDCVFYKTKNEKEQDKNLERLIGTFYTKDVNNNINFAINRYGVLFKDDNNNFTTLSKNNGIYIKEFLTSQNKELELNIDSGFRFETVGKSKILMRDIGNEKKIIMQSGGSTGNQIEFSSSGNGVIANSLIVNNITINKDGINMTNNKVSFLKNSILNEDIRIDSGGLHFLKGTNKEISNNGNITLSFNNFQRILSDNTIETAANSNERFSDVALDGRTLHIYRKNLKIKKGLYWGKTEDVYDSVTIPDVATEIVNYITNSDNRGTITDNIDTESIVNEAIGRLFEALHENNGGPLSTTDMLASLRYLQSEYGFDRLLQNIGN